MKSDAKGREQAEAERREDIGRSRESNFENNEQGYLFIEPRAMSSFGNNDTRELCYERMIPRDRVPDRDTQTSQESNGIIGRWNKEHHRVTVTGRCQSNCDGRILRNSIVLM